MFSKLLNILTHPIFIISGAVLGMLIGHYSHVWPEILAPYGTIYLSLIKMTIYPILISSVAYSFASLLRSQQMREMFKKLGIIYIIGMMVSSGLGIMVAQVGGIGNHLSTEQQRQIGQHLSANEDVVLNEVNAIDSVPDFLQSMIPSNFIEAYSESNTLGVLLFAILLGISLGFVPSRSSTSTLRMFEGLYETFLKLLNGIIYLLPFALIAMFADLFSHVGLGMLVALGRLLIFTYLGVGLLIIIYLLLISFKFKLGFWGVLSVFRKPLVIAITTSTSFASIPHSIYALIDKLKLNDKQVKLAIPIGTSVGQQCSPFAFSMMTMFMVQLYGLPVDSTMIALVFFLSIVTGIAAGGGPPITGLILISIPLTILGLPTEAAIAIFLVVINIMDPIVVVGNVSANCMAVSWVAKKQTNVEAVDSNE